MGFYFVPKKIYLIHHFLFVCCLALWQGQTHETFISVIPGQL